jgi:heme-degrading monooxygenase HmoA
MYARITTNRTQPDRIDHAIMRFKELVGPIAKNMAGHKGSYFMADRKTGKIVGVTLWDTMENLEASANAAAQVRTQIGQESSDLPVVEIFEVAAQF